jgi:hypothetical protein
MQSTPPAPRASLLLLLLPLVLASLLLLAGCSCRDVQVEYPGGVAPDEQYTAGTAPSRVEFYVWHCVKGERLVVIRKEMEMSCAPPRRETAVCGELTSLEQKFANEPHGPAGTVNVGP